MALIYTSVSNKCGKKNESGKEEEEDKEGHREDSLEAETWGGARG